MGSQTVASGRDFGVDQRRHPRRKVLKRGQIVYNRGFCVMDCVILDVSASGALITPEEKIYFPDNFSLRFHDGPMCSCKVVHRGAKAVGVKFLDGEAPEILLVDDGMHFSLLPLHAYELSSHFEVHSVASPAHALGLIDKGRTFAAVVATMNMSAMNGIELAREVGKRSASTMTILLSDHTDPEAEKRAYANGEVFRFLTMPCGLDKMLPAVKDSVSEYRRRSASAKASI